MRHRHVHRLDDATYVLLNRGDLAASIEGTLSGISRLAAMPGDLLNREASMLTKLGDEQTSIAATL